MSWLLTIVSDRDSVPTILDVARRAGVSKSVVSRVLTGASGVANTTRERVQSAIDELGYVANAMARGMVARRTNTIGVFVRDVATPFYAHLLTAMQERAAARGYRVVTATGSGQFAAADERRALETLVGLQVEGLVVCTGLLPVSEVLPMAQRVPTIIAGRPETDASLSSVYCDEEGGGRGLADHVWSLGHRRVAVMAMSPEKSLTLAPRTAAMARRLRELGADVLEMPDDLPPERDPGRVDEVVEEVLATQRVTALMTPSDRYAVEALEALQRRGRQASDDLSVTGYDGIKPLTTPLLGLTTWAQPVAVIGAKAVDEVVDQIEGTSLGHHHHMVDGHLIVGRTAVKRRF